MGQHHSNPMAIAARAGAVIPKNGQGPQQINLDVRDLQRRACGECGSTHFVQRKAFYEIPELLRFAAPQGANMVIAEDLICLKCGKPQEFASLQLLPSLNQLARDEKRAQGAEDGGRETEDGGQKTDETAEAPHAKPMIEIAAR